MSQTTAQAIAELVGACERAAQGDLEARVTGIDPNSELAPVAQAINGLLDIADAYVRESATATEHYSRGQFHRPILLRGLKGAYRSGARSINRAGVKMRESKEQIAFAAKQAAENTSTITTVAAACEELSSTSTEISRQTAECSRSTESSVEQANRAAATVSVLNETVKKIERMLTLIVKVAGQTNLLALNATIEAARAGEHGKGFAVVATEVKELSRSTATATGEIGQEIEKVRKTVEQATRFIGEVNQSIQQIDRNVQTIEHSLQEQLTATSEISRSVLELTRTTSLVSERITGASAVH